MNKEYTNQQKDAILNIEKITYVGATTHVPMLDLHTNATTNDDYLCVKRIYDTLSQNHLLVYHPSCYNTEHILPSLFVSHREYL